MFRYLYFDGHSFDGILRGNTIYKMFGCTRIRLVGREEE